MTTTASQIIADASLVLNDFPGSIWTEAELLGWLNDAAVEIVNIAPNAGVVNALDVPLVAGTLQSLPVGGIQLLDVPRNVGAGGAVQRRDREKVTRMNPGWASSPASAAVKVFFYDPATPTQFEVFPPNTGAGRVVVRYVAVPARMASAAADWPLPDWTRPAALDYVLFRALGRDETPAAQQMSAAHQAMFAAKLGAKAQVDHAEQQGRTGAVAGAG